MKREEKNIQSRQKIMDAAMQEFGGKSYIESSLNIICSKGNLSKGIIYHYFTDKDELYLACVKECFDELTNYLGQQHYDFSDFQKGIQQYFAARYEFFHQFPQYSRLFFRATFQIPPHLEQEIKERRKDFDALNVQYFKNVLSYISLRENVAEQDAIRYFMFFQQLFHGAFQANAFEDSNFNEVVDEHEMKLSTLLDLVLYGIAKEEAK